MIPVSLIPSDSRNGSVREEYENPIGTCAQVPEMRWGP